MLVKMIHPEHPETTQMCDPQKRKRLLKLGWYDEQKEPMADVMQFQQRKEVKTADEIEKFVKTTCTENCHCSTAPTVEVEETEEVITSESTSQPEKTDGKQRTRRSTKNQQK